MLVKNGAAARPEFTAGVHDVITAHHDLVNDPPHLRNILDPTYNVVGVGIIKSGRHIYVTEDFARVIYEPSKAH